MKKTVKRILAGMLCAAMILPTMACGEGSGASEEPIRITMFSQLANFSGEQTGWSAQILRDKFNVIVDIVPDGDGVLQTRMSDGNIGDIVVWGSDGANYQTAVSSGLLYDWEYDDLLHTHGAYIEEHMQNALEKNKEMNGGKLYGFGHNVATSADDHEAFFYTWDLRWDLYKELGYPKYNTMDEFVDVLAQMKEICPTDDTGKETYAVSIWPDWDGNMVMYVKAFATAFYGYDEMCIGLYDPETGAFHDALEENGPYLQSLKFFNNLYQRGLLDPNSMTQTYDDMSEKCRNGGTFFSIFNYAGCLIYNEKHAADNKLMMSWCPGDATPIVYGLSTLGGNRVWSIGANTEHPELCMEIINWLCTPEGYMTYNYGPQGLTWDYDEEGYAYFTEFGKTAYFDKDTPMIGDYEGTGTYNDGSLQVNNTTWTINAINLDSKVGETYNYEYWKSYQQEAQNAIEQDWRDYTGTTSTQEYMNSLKYRVSPGSAYQEGKRSDDLDTKWSAVTDTIVTYSWKAIYCESDADYDATVAAMIQEAKDYGYEECKEWSEGECATRYAAEQEVR